MKACRICGRLSYLYSFEIFRTVLAQGADIVSGEFLTLVDIAADFAYPAGFLFAGGCGLGLHMIKIVLISHTGHIVQHMRLSHFSDEQGVAAPIIAFHNLAGQNRIAVLGDIPQTVFGAVIVRNGSKLIGISTGAEAKLLEYSKGSLFVQNGNIEHTGANDHIVGEVSLVHSQLDALGIVGDQTDGIGDAAVISAVFPGGYNEQTVAELKHSAVIQLGCRRSTGGGENGCMDTYG